MTRIVRTSGAEGAHPSPMRRAWKIIAVVVTAIALAWVLKLLVDAWPGLLAHRAQISVSQLVLALLLSIAAAYLTFEAFAVILRALSPSTLLRRELAHLYFTAQLLKHLPGRVWGIGYQWATAGGVHTFGSWLRANILLMVLATYFALWSSCIALAWGIGVVWAIAAALAGLAGYALLWFLPSMFRRVLPAAIKRRLDDGAFDAVSAVSSAVRWHLLLLFAASWVVYYAAWYFNGRAYGPLGGAGGVRMCAYYMLAWFVGYVSLLTPSGLGVRELVFAWLAKDFPPDAVALMALVGRVSLLAVDLVMGLVFAPFAPRKSAGN